MRIIEINNKNSLNVAVEILKQYGILVFPTDTVYGIGCLLSGKPIRRLYKIKNRPLTQPTAVLITKNLYHKMLSSAKSGIDLADHIQADFLDGKVTIVFLTRMFKMKFPEIITKDNKIGIRLPQSAWLEKLINVAGPIVTSSANKKGEPAPARFAEVDQNITEQVDLTIKTDEDLPGIPSKVYDLEHKRYIR